MKIINTDATDTKDFYKEHGLSIIRKALIKETESVMKEVLNFLVFYGKKNNLINGDEKYDDLVRKIMVPQTKLRTFIYDSVPLLNSIQDLKHNPLLRKHLKTLGFKNPVAVDMGNVRFDIKKESEKKFLRGVHQDIRSIKTKKTITMWIPLTEVNQKRGTVVIYPGTHRDTALYEHIYDPNLVIPNDKLPKSLEDLEKEKYIINAKPGDICLFDCFVLHRSQPAEIDCVRSVLQFTYTDIDEFNEKDNLFFLSSEFQAFARKEESLKKISTLN